MRIYRGLYILAACVATFMAAGLVSLGIQDQRWLLVVGSVGVVFLWWYAFYRLEKGSITLSVVVTSLACCFMLLQLNDYRRFVIENGGWERADGYGSPLAFLLNLTMELFWFTFFFVTAMCGLRIALKQRDDRHRARETTEIETVE